MSKLGIRRSLKSHGAERWRERAKAEQPLMIILHVSFSRPFIIVAGGVRLKIGNLSALIAGSNPPELIIESGTGGWSGQMLPSHGGAGAWLTRLLRGKTACKPGEAGLGAFPPVIFGPRRSPLGRGGSGSSCDGAGGLRLTGRSLPLRHHRLLGALKGT